MADPDRAPLAGADGAIVAYALKLTRDPKGMRRKDVEGLRAAGLTDPEIFEVALFTSYYNYTNRVAEGLGVEPEPK
jgi:alkylhydroperoxidase family enzyme